MFIRRLMSRLGRIFSRHPARGWRTAAVVTAVSSRRSGVSRAGLRNWLEDGRRLRPALPAQLSRGRGMVGDVAAMPVDVTRERVVSGRMRVSDPPAVGQPPASKTPPPSGPARGAIPLKRPSPLPDLTSAEAVLQAAEGMDEVWRRLVFVRYLVRQRVYNEGFGADEMPEQYRWQSGEPDGN
jgi:hypothetical protein